MEESQRIIEMYRFEREFYERDIVMVAGCDEAGRGPLAGPVVAAAVILPPFCEIPQLNDSKKLTEKKRFALEPEIKEKAVSDAVLYCCTARIVLQCKPCTTHRFFF